MGSDDEVYCSAQRPGGFPEAKSSHACIRWWMKLSSFFLNVGPHSLFICDYNIWFANLAYRASIYEKLNEPYLSIQGPNKHFDNLRQSKCIQKKAGTMAVRSEEGNVEIFPLLEEFIEKNELHAFLDNMRGAIAIHLGSPFDHFKNYFKEETTLQQHDWIRQRSLLPRVTCLRSGWCTAWPFAWSNLTDEVWVDCTGQVLDITGRRISRIIQDRKECTDAFRVDQPLWSYIFCPNIHEKKVPITTLCRGCFHVLRFLA